MIARGDAQAKGTRKKVIVVEHPSGRAIDAATMSSRTWAYEPDTAILGAAEYSRVSQNARARQGTRLSRQKIHRNLRNAGGKRARRLAAAKAGSEPRRDARADPSRVARGAGVPDRLFGRTGRQGAASGRGVFDAGTTFLGTGFGG